MNERSLICAVKQLVEKIGFICENLSGDAQTLGDISACAERLYISVACGKMSDFEREAALKACLRIEKHLDTLYKSRVISLETSKQLRNLAIKISRHLRLLCACEKKKIKV